VAVVAADHRKGGTPIIMRTITKSVLFGSPGRSGMSAPALVTLASAMAALALVILALSASAAQSAERHNGNTTPLKGGKTWLKLDKGTAAALSDAGVKVKATGAAIAPSAKRPAFAFPIVGGKVERIRSAAGSCTPGGSPLAPALRAWW
jgi:hypothetical protein